MERLCRQFIDNALKLLHHLILFDPLELGSRLILEPALQQLRSAFRLDNGFIYSAAASSLSPHSSQSIDNALKASASSASTHSSSAVDGRRILERVSHFSLSTGHRHQLHASSLQLDDDRVLQHHHLNQLRGGLLDNQQHYYLVISRSYQLPGTRVVGHASPQHHCYLLEGGGTRPAGWRGRGPAVFARDPRGRHLWTGLKPYACSRLKNSAGLECVATMLSRRSFF
ncbi:hypothetical protein C8R44DRAFT_985512 [Mycena epipterygia]|nr:hypothetical protein C8R44DRAFT_985512 [Mycena epipterygia]